jgi:hypothetical protein
VQSCVVAAPKTLGGGDWHVWGRGDSIKFGVGAR